MMATLNMSMGSGGLPLCGTVDAPPDSPSGANVIGGEYDGDILGGEGGEQIGAES